MVSYNLSKSSLLGLLCGVPLVVVGFPLMLLDEPWFAAGVVSYVLGWPILILSYKGWRTKKLEILRIDREQLNRLVKERASEICSKSGDEFYMPEIRPEDLKELIRRCRELTVEVTQPSLVKSLKYQLIDQLANKLEKYLRDKLPDLPSNPDQKQWAHAYVSVFKENKAYEKLLAHLVARRNIK